MDGEEATLVPPSGAAGDHSADDVLRKRAALLLAAAEAAEARSGGDHQETAWREAIVRILETAATLRNAVAAQALEMVETASRERALIAAEVQALRGELDVLRAEIAMLRGERDLALALTLEASSAVARYLDQWHQWHGNAADGTAQAYPGSASPGSLDAAESVLAAATQSIAHQPTLAGAKIAPGASNPAAILAVTITAMPGLVPLVEMEPALVQLPCVRRCSVKTLRRGQASLELVLDPPTAPLVVAAEILGLPAHPLIVESVGEQRIAVRFAGRS